MSSQTNTETTIDQKVKTPRMFIVIFHNDDTTPMDFVIYVLRTIFRLSVEESEEITLRIHHTDSAVVGTYSCEIAEQKVAETTSISRSNNYPLTVTMQPE